MTDLLWQSGCAENEIDIRYSAGIRVDSNKLIEKFIRTDSLRYEEFSKIWREMKMSLIFYGREDYRELQEFTETVLNMAKHLWFHPENDIHLQVAGFYLTYAFYMKQPLKSHSPVKIRMTLDDWDKATTFVNFLLENEHWDAYYIFCKLIVDSAFDFVFERSAIFPGKYTESSEEIPSNKQLCESRLQAYVNDVTFQLLQSQHEAYEAMKSDVIPQQLCLTDGNLMQTITKLANTSEKNCSVETSAESTLVDSSDIGQRRLQLKRKGFKMM